MPLRQTIGISLALFMASSGAMAETPDEGTAHHSTASQKAAPEKSTSRTARTQGGFRWPEKLAFHRGRPRWSRHVVAGTSAALPDWGPMHSTGYQQIGEAAWYALVGSRTSSGERLDTETPTAAHRTLPLGSCARVTSLDTGRSVVVKINDRGPYRRRFIIDLSPRAAAELGMMHAGTAAVAIQPVAAGAAPAAAVAPAPAYRVLQAANVSR
jgi:rare lipoprotein A (peptidoglycan hydrolase)